MGAHHSSRSLFLRFRFDPIWVIDDEDNAGHAAHEAGYRAEAQLLAQSHFDGVWVGDRDADPHHPLVLGFEGNDLYKAVDEESWQFLTEVAFPDSAASTRCRGVSTTKISIPEWDREGSMQADGSILWGPLGKGSTSRPIDAAGLRWVRPFDGRWETPEGIKIGSIFGYHLTKGDGSVRLALDYYYAEGKWIIQFDGNGPNGLCTGELVEMDGKKAIKWEATDKVPEGDPLSIWVWGPLPGEGLPKSGGLCGGPATASGLCGPATAGSASDSASALVDHQGLAKASNNSDVGSGSSFYEVEAESSIPAEGAERVLLKYPHLLVHRVDALNANSGIYIEDLLE